jgi:tRNA A-37 threonylcarbamoyl transferase component Bud32
MSDLRDELQRTLGDSYTLERELGGGGMSRVFVAEDNSLGRKVVVKVLSPDLTAGVNVDRFKREIQLAARLLQAQIVPVLSAGELDGVPYYTMPFVEGESLRAKLARTGALPIPEVVSILRDVTRALAYAHERGVVHRDIKPDNVLLSGGTAVVTDFGIAKALTAAKNEAPLADTSLTQHGTSVGTPAYISPEQAAGDPNVDHRADIYSLGCMAYELLTGQPPFAGRSPQRTLAAHLTEAPRPIEDVRPDVPPGLAALVMRCLEKEPSARPQSAAEIGGSLDGVPSGVSSAAQLTGPGATTRAMLWYIVAFGAVAIVAKAAVVGIGLPDWVFSGAVLVMILVFGLVVAAAWAHRTTRHIAAQTPVLTPTSGATHGTMTNVALRANRYLTWRRVFRTAAISVLSFAIAVVAVMVLRGFGVGPAASLLAAGRLHGRERLLITDFAAGKDSSLSHVVTEAVRTNLGQSKAVSIMPPTAIAAALQRMQRPASGSIDIALGREIAVREGVKALVGGSITPLGSGYVVSIRLVSADSGSDLAAFQKTVNGASDLLDAIDDLTRKLRGRIGESLKSVRDTPPLDQVTTSSIEALRLYVEATRASDLDGDYVKSEKLLRQAVARDTTFAMAYRKLGVTLGNLGMPRAPIDSALSRAYQYRERLPELERYITIATYYQTGPGFDRQKAAEAWQQALAVDSTEVAALVNLANNYRSRRQLARAESLYAAVNASPRGQLCRDVVGRRQAVRRRIGVRRGTPPLPQCPNRAGLPRGDDVSARPVRLGRSILAHPQHEPQSGRQTEWIGQPRERDDAAWPPRRGTAAHRPNARGQRGARSTGQSATRLDQLGVGRAVVLRSPGRGRTRARRRPRTGSASRSTRRAAPLLQAGRVLCDGRPCGSGEIAGRPSGIRHARLVAVQCAGADPARGARRDRDRRTPSARRRA